MRKIFILLLVITSFIYSQSNNQFSDYPITSVSIKDVILNDNFWLPKIQLIQDTTIRYAFDKCEKEGRMQNFLVAGGKLKGSYKGKMPFDDTDLYKIIEGASYSLISKPNPELDRYLDSIIAIINERPNVSGTKNQW